ncbi:MAG: hypothetical protein ABUL54_08750 [Dongia sp.]
MEELYMATSNSYVLFGGDVALWTEDDAIMLKTCDPNGEPVELSAEDAATLAGLLRELAEQAPK